MAMPPGCQGGKLINACRRGDLEEVTSLLKSGIKPDHRTVPRTALHVASEQGHLQVATELVKNGARVNALDEEGHTPLHRACFEGHKEVVQFLIEEGADVNKQGYDGSTSLHQASSEGHVKIVEMLLASKAKTSLLIKDWERSVLHVASMGGHTDLINILLHAGLDVNQTDKNFMTSLIFATIQGHTQAVKFLIKSGAKLNEYNKDGMTALLYAAKKDMFEVADILVAAGADVNMQESRRWSAIFFVAQKGNRAMVKILVEAGADVEIINKKGQSVFDVKMPDPLVHRELLLAKGPAELQKSVEIPGKVSCSTSSPECPGVTVFLNVQIDVLGLSDKHQYTFSVDKMNPGDSALKRDGHYSDKRYTPVEESKTFTIDDLQDILELLVDVSRWLPLGLALGLKKPTLDKIEQDKKDIENCKIEMLTQWLNCVDNTKPSPVSLEAALKKHTVRLEKIADDVHKCYMK